MLAHVTETDFPIGLITFALGILVGAAASWFMARSPR